MEEGFAIHFRISEDIHFPPFLLEKNVKYSFKILYIFKERRGREVKGRREGERSIWYLSSQEMHLVEKLSLIEK